MPDPARSLFCLGCRRALPRSASACARCGDDSPLDLERATDREIVQTALRAALVPVVGAMVGALMAISVVAAPVAAGSGVPAAWVEALLYLPLLLVAPSVALGTALVRRRWGLAAHDVATREELEEKRATRIAWATGVPLWAAIAVLAVHGAHELGALGESAWSALTLTLGELRSGALSPALVGHALRHATWLHVGLNALGLVAFGSMVERRVGRAGAALLLFAGVVTGALAEGWLSSLPNEVRLVGISGGVYAWLAAPLALDPTMRTTVRIRFVRFAAPMWLRVLVVVGLFGLVDGLTRPEIAVGAHLGGALAGALLAWPMRLIPESAAYRAWRARAEQRASDEDE